MEVVMVDVDESKLQRAMSAMADSLSRMVRKGALQQAAADSSLSRVQQVTNLKGIVSAMAADVDIVVEAVVEDEVTKLKIFRDLDILLPPAAILASNTSSISITCLAAATSRPSQVIGMHFMNPPPLMPLVEIIRGMQTSEEVYRSTRKLAERFGKTVCVAADYPGFLVNRILMPMVNEAFFALMEGVASADDIDASMRLGTRHPMGPLQLADFIGLDTCLAILRVLHKGLGDDKYRPCPLLLRYVAAGWLGRKAGRGVYLYPD
eukprot:TRINITY_DN7772_c1_g2_i1.p1 TRINITY_DN7772_c1_g2~~TRINITY_DN7772_c1_g2_i1.p1  ORF type:complete len:264 (+),score=88.30 TRINITY_DN7772_c1_g2_i1:1-792(+)